MLEVGQTIERYVVEAVVGQGGMAVVYRVRHLRLGSRHALKVLTVVRPAVLKRLLREGRVQAELHHPNVVTVNDVLDYKGAPALLMEYVDGPTLEWLLEHHPPPLDEALSLFRGVCCGVSQAHARGLVHRDLKPANVLLSRRTDGCVPKVTDFGIAKIVQSDMPSGATGSQVAMGTPCYMAPEQIRDARSVDQRADVFSLGCILYELACGVRPFDGPDVLSLLNAVADGDYLPPLERRPDLPPYLVALIDGCLQVEMDDRIQSSAEILDRLGGSDGRDGRHVFLSEGVEPLAEAPVITDEVSDDEDDYSPIYGDDSPSGARGGPPDPSWTHGGALAPTPVIRSSRDSFSSPVFLDSDAATVPQPPARRTGERGHVPESSLRSFGRMLLVGVLGGTIFALLVAVAWLGYEHLPLERGSTSPSDARHGLPVEVMSGSVEPTPWFAAEDLEVPDTATPLARSPSAALQGFETRSSKSSGGFLFSGQRIDPQETLEPEPGRVTIGGSYYSVGLRSGMMKYPAGNVPPGRYWLEVAYERDEEPEVALEIEVVSGENTHVICEAEDRVCAHK